MTTAGRRDARQVENRGLAMDLVREQHDSSWVSRVFPTRLATVATVVAIIADVATIVGLVVEMILERSLVTAVGVAFIICSAFLLGLLIAGWRALPVARRPRRVVRTFVALSLLFTGVGGVYLVPGSPLRAATQIDSFPQPGPPPSETHPETAGTVVHTWSNYKNAGGVRGKDIPKGMTVQVECWVRGQRVTDGNTWWYRIASHPWNGKYYASADSFHTEGHTSGPLIGAFYDAAVPPCA
jgi:hypothetical protein